MRHVGLFFVYLKLFKQTFQLSQLIIVGPLLTKFSVGRMALGQS